MTNPVNETPPPFHVDLGKESGASLADASEDATGRIPRIMPEDSSAAQTPSTSQLVELDGRLFKIVQDSTGQSFRIPYVPPAPPPPPPILDARTQIFSPQHAKLEISGHPAVVFPWGEAVNGHYQRIVAPSTHGRIPLHGVQQVPQLGQPSQYGYQVPDYSQTFLSPEQQGYTDTGAAGAGEADALNELLDANMTSQPDSKDTKIAAPSIRSLATNFINKRVNTTKSTRPAAEKVAVSDITSSPMFQKISRKLFAAAVIIVPAEIAFDLVSYDHSSLIGTLFRFAETGISAFKKT